MRRRDSLFGCLLIGNTVVVFAAGVVQIGRDGGSLLEIAFFTVCYAAIAAATVRSIWRDRIAK